MVNPGLARPAGTNSRTPARTQPRPPALTPCAENPRAWDIGWAGEATASNYLKHLDKARKLCGDCPLLKACARYATDMTDGAQQPHNVWIGITIAGVPFMPGEWAGARRAAWHSVDALAIVARDGLDAAHAHILDQCAGWPEYYPNPHPRTDPADVVNDPAYDRQPVRTNPAHATTPVAAPISPIEAPTERRAA